MSTFDAILRPDLRDLASYVPHAGEFAVRLDANEAPTMLSEEARRKLAEAASSIDFNRYPDARLTALREAIAEASDATPDEILVGCGSDEVITMLLTALDHPPAGAPATTIATTTPTFVMYRLSARTRGMRVFEVPLDSAWDLDVKGMRTAIEVGRPNIVFIATPNNPTGALMSEDRLVSVIEAAPNALVVVDEAYIDYAPRQQLALRHRFPNVAILRTLSKVGFAALRVGWLVGPKELVREVDKARSPYNLCTPSQRAATLALRELRPEIERLVASVVSERERLAVALRGLGLDVPESHANFLWVGTNKPAKELFEGLAARGVLVRSFHAAGGRLATRLRITVGLPHENDRFLDELSKLV